MASDLFTAIFQARETIHRCGETVHAIEMSPDLAARLKNATDDATVLSVLIPTDVSCFGMKVFIDPSLAPGEWKIVAEAPDR